MSTAVVLTLLAYLIGSIAFAVIVSRVFRLPDPRSYGSHNPGATNVLRTGRKTAALLTLLGDGAKGWVAVVIASRFAEWLISTGSTVTTRSLPRESTNAMRPTARELANMILPGTS